MPEDQYIEWKESWGRGIEKINKGCVAHDIEPANFDFRMSGLMVTFTANPAHLPEKVLPKKSAEEGSSGTREENESTRVKILELMEADPSISITLIAKKLGLTVKGVEWQVRQMKKSGNIERVGPAKGGKWKVIRKEL